MRANSPPTAGILQGVAEMDFFDFQEKRRKAANSEAAPASRQILSVAQLTTLIERAIKSGVPGQVLVRGEVSNYKAYGGSGHIYFTLKDAECCIDCVIFRSDAVRLKFNFSDGMAIIATGRVAVYGQRGKYQLYVSTLQPVGKGALEIAFAQLREKLAKEGLFARERKKALPRYPLRIALVTSRETAALQDMLKVLRRFAFLQLLLYHVPVQGEGAAQKIAGALTEINRDISRIGGVDVILLGRGGGSLEDLWQFNEEIVARAVATSVIPIVTGIGHEVDVSIADLAADYHAHTPTEAAQVVTSQWRAVVDNLEMSGVRLRRQMRTILQESRQRLVNIARHEMFRRPLDRINARRQFLDDRQKSLVLAVGTRLRLAERRVDDSGRRLEASRPQILLARFGERIESLSERLRRRLEDGIQRRQLRVDSLEKQLEALSPLAVLNRGYTITTRKKDGSIVRRVEQVKPGDHLLTRLPDGEVESIAEDKSQPRLFE